MDQSEQPPYVSIVVIGMNEAANLCRAFASIRNIDYPADKIEVLYVDTGSSDNSIEIAKKFTDKIFIERSFWPTPGLARNRGLVEAKYDIIHFVDGDMEIDRNYLSIAIKKIKEPDIDAVYGSLEEKSKTGINMILISHWKNRKEGFHKATGGGGTYKRKLLLSINGSDERIRKGEETEMGERFTKAGFKIWFIEDRMGYHDYGINKFPDLVRLFFLEGKNISHIMFSKGTSDFYLRSKRKAINNILFVPGTLIILIALLMLFNLIGILIWLGLLYSYFLIKTLLIIKDTDVHKFKYRFIAYNLRTVVLAGQLFFLAKCLFVKSYRKKVFKLKMNFNN